MRVSKTEKVLKYLQTHKRGITSLQAIEKFGATRLADIIYRLKNNYGYNIKAEMVDVKDRYNTKVRVARYTLVEDK